MNADQLDQTKCATPGCTECDHQLYLTQKCHPEAGVEVVYHKGTNLAHVICHQCKERVVTLELYNPKGQ